MASPLSTRTGHHGAIMHAALLHYKPPNSYFFTIYTQYFISKYVNAIFPVTMFINCQYIVWCSKSLCKQNKPINVLFSSTGTKIDYKRKESGFLVQNLPPNNFIAAWLHLNLWHQVCWKCSFGLSAEYDKKYCICAEVISHSLLAILCLIHKHHLDFRQETCTVHFIIEQMSQILVVTGW